MIHTILSIILWLAIGSLIVTLARFLAMLVSSVGLFIGIAVGKLFKPNYEANDWLQETESFIQLAVYVVLGITIWGKLLSYHLHWLGIWQFLQHVYVVTLVLVVVNFFALIFLGARYKNFEIFKD